jgi:hypothetical protein
MSAGSVSAQYLITRPESLMNNGADYLVVTHNNFTASMNRLCRLRDSLGLRVKMAEVSLVYQNFLTSRPRADRIKAFLHQVYNAWSPRPQYVLLVGDANRTDSTRDYLPSKLFPKFSYPYAFGGTQHASDNWYAELADSNYIPDIVIGRLPVSSTASADSVVSKIVRYETTPPSGQWLRTVLVDISEDMVSYANQYHTLYFRPAGDSVIEVYWRNVSNPTSDSLRRRTIQAFNQGVVFAFPVCHGAEIAWACSQGYTLFDSSDVYRLTNTSYPTSFGWG